MNHILCIDWKKEQKQGSRDDGRNEKHAEEERRKATNLKPETQERKAKGRLPRFLWLLVRYEDPADGRKGVKREENVSEGVGREGGRESVGLERDKGTNRIKIGIFTCRDRQRWWG